MNISTPRALVRVGAVMVMALALGAVAVARQNADGAMARPSGPDGAKKVLTLADYGPWKRVTAAAISDDGKWATYTYSPNDGDETLYVKQLDGEMLHTIGMGTAPGGGARGGGAPAAGGRGGGGGGAQFSDDSRWIAYFVNPPGARAGGAPAPGSGQAGGRGAGPTPGAGQGRGAGAAASPAAPPPAARKLELLELATGTKFDVPNAAGFQFSKGSQWLAVKMNGVANDTSHRGADLILRKLGNGAVTNIGNVNQYSFDEKGDWLAYTVDATGRMGNGVYAMKLGTGETRPLDTGDAEYDGLAWRSESTSLVALRGDKPKGKAQKANVLVAWADVAAVSPTRIEIDPAKDGAFPKNFILSEFTPPRWSKDGRRVFVGIKEQDDAAPEPAGQDAANVDIWHWKDVDLQSEQILGVAQARRATFAGVFTLASKAFVRLADETIPTITPTADDTWAIGRDATPYAHDFAEGNPARADYYRIDTATGARTLIAKKLLRTMGTSPDSQWFLYLQNQHVMAHQLATGRTVNVDQATARSFVNTDNDQAAEKPVWGVAGWTKDGKAVLLNDKYDIWSLPLDGGRGTSVTGGAGAAQQVVLRLAPQFAPSTASGPVGGRAGGAGANEAIDLSRPQTLSAYGEWTKKSGYWRLPAAAAAPAANVVPTPLIWADKQIGGVIKAKNADRVLFTQQTFEEFPDYWTGDSSFSAPRKITDANPQITQYAWGRRVLVDYTNAKGRKLQATLTLPAGYEPGKKYPMLVYIYELLSNTHHTFSMPVYDDRPHMSAYASDGYLVLEPDIVYDIGKPGTSALDCVTAAVKKTIDLGYADPQHIGLQGHSWGGYESSFILTQTSMFAAVVTGAPLTNLISMYDILYKQSGNWNGGILETSQGRMGANVTPSNAHDLYERESPIFHVTKIQTPFLILQGTADGAVDWNQGLELYTSARRNGKNVIFLSYPDEPHHLAKAPNQKDFQTRMKQYFDHYLKGAPMPQWMKDGLPQTKKGEAIK